MKSCSPTIWLGLAVSTLTLHPFAMAQPLPSIFTGSDLSGWNVPTDNIWFQAVDGVLQVKNGPQRKGAVLWTSNEYANFIMEFEFKMGDGTVDSGVYVRDEREQIQIGISGSRKRDMTGSPYISGKGYPVEADGVQKLLKTDDWNRMTIVAKGNNYQVWLNGRHVMSYDSDTAAEKGPIGIQLHQGREMSIEYRDIRLAELQ